MDDGANILDYASPRKRGKLRLPARSVVTVAGDDRRLVVTERLVGHPQAVLALLFGAGVVALCVVAGAVATYDWAHHRRYREILPGVMLDVLGVAELATMVGVVHQTWGRTVLSAEYDDLRLSFASPVRRRRYRWAGAEIADVVLVPTANAETALPLAELLVTRVAGGDVRLFTDHPARRLAPIARAVHDLLRDGRCDPPAAPPAEEPLVSPDLLERAERTAGRLAEVRRHLQQRRGPG